MTFNYEQSIWGKGTASLKWGDPTAFRLRQALNAIEKLPSSGKVLELGAGAGQFIRAVHASRVDLACYGSDISSEAIRLATQANDGVQYVLSGESTVPFADNFFDAVLIFDVLEHVTNPAAILAEVHRVLKPGGVLYAFVPCEGDSTSLWHLLDGFGLKKNLTRKHAGHINYFSRKDLLNLVCHGESFVLPLTRGGVPAGTEGSSGEQMEQREDPTVTRERDSSPSEGERKPNDRFELVCVRYSEHVIGQLLGVIAFYLMERSSSLSGGVQINNEAYFEKQHGGVFNVIRKLVNAWVYVESTVLQRIPSPNVHIIAKKK